MYAVPNRDILSLIFSQTCELIGIDSNRRHSESPIGILNDDVLLNIFHLYRLADPDQYYNDGIGTVFVWHRQRWWYKLAHVCRQWRNLILESPSRLDLHLYCTNGVPVADMLAHSLPLPLTIDYRIRDHEILTAEDQSGLFLALSHRDRVRHIYFRFFNVRKFVTVMDDQFPVLERMYIHSRTEVVLPETFQAPNLRYLRLSTVCIPIVSPLLTITAAGLVTLELLNIPASAYFPPSYILPRLSLMLQLEILFIGFHSYLPNRDVERQLHQTPDMITLPNLRWFAFNGVGAYLEGLVARISAPSLSFLHVKFQNSHQLSFTFPHLLQFIQKSENLRLAAVRVTFGALGVSLHAVPWKWDTPLLLQIKCDPGHLDWHTCTFCCRTSHIQLRRTRAII
jgi:hypothetical protein